MTVVSNLLVKGQPVLIGDTVLTTTEEGAKSIAVPTVERLPALKMPISGFCRKVYIMDRKLAVAWSGSRSQAEIVLFALKAQIRKRGVYFVMAVTAARATACHAGHVSRIAKVPSSHSASRARRDCAIRACWRLRSRKVAAGQMFSSQRKPYILIGARRKNRKALFCQDVDSAKLRNRTSSSLMI
jgi:hypothetical protein